MSRHERLLQTILLGRSDANIRFAELRRLLLRLGFGERVRGSHHIFTRDDIEEQINLQEKGGAAKVYQVRQVRRIIRKYVLWRFK